MKRAPILLLAFVALAACSTDSPCPSSKPGVICTVAGSGPSGYGGDGGSALKAIFYTPQDTRISPEGELWIDDFNNYRIRAVDDKGNIRTVIGNGLLGDSPMPGETMTPALDAYFNHTTDLFFSNGWLYLAAWHNSYIKRVDLSTMMLEDYAGEGTRTKYAGDGGPALQANLDLPSSIALAPNGDVVIMDQANMVIRSVDANGIINRIAGECVIDDPSTGPCANPQPCPNSDKLACGDLTTQCALACSPGYSGDGGDPMMARMSQPYGQMADPAGRLEYNSKGDLIFADTNNNRIRMISGGVITTIAGTGMAGYSGDDGPATQAQINHPVDIAIAPDDSVYFTDVQNNCVRKIDTTGTISAVAGICAPGQAGRGFSGDGGDALKAKLNRPYGIDLAGDKLYISDSYNNRIRVVNLQ